MWGFTDFQKVFRFIRQILIKSTSERQKEQKIRLIAIK
ncbi:hypothetical protein MYAER_3961 [Microcystis aeruginosa NIES-2549]|uniref:Uncharacterized protein n=1 Tax=Microcystis aeruginosa NIES-2549 TaxID=1641812 RepID=A0A0F6U6V9_MICAE|nr:hypothetical protein MYAER_3961 [Microcystis aeruginosa NIES-2549]